MIKGINQFVSADFQGLKYMCDAIVYAWQDQVKAYDN